MNFLKQRKIWQQLRIKNDKIKIIQPQPEIPCERVLEGLKMMKTAVQTILEQNAANKMLGSQIDIAFYMVISLLEAFSNSL